MWTFFICRLHFFSKSLTTLPSSRFEIFFAFYFVIWLLNNFFLYYYPLIVRNYLALLISSISLQYFWHVWYLHSPVFSIWNPHLNVFQDNLENIGFTSVHLTLILCNEIDFSKMMLHTEIELGQGSVPIRSYAFSFQLLVSFYLGQFKFCRWDSDIYCKVHMYVRNRMHKYMYIRGYLYVHHVCIHIKLYVHSYIQFVLLFI